MALPSEAAKILLKDGRTLEGKVAQISGVAEDPNNPKIPAGGVAVTPILLVDDGLRRTYVHKFHVREVLEQAHTAKVRINIWQHVAENGAGLASVGRSTRVTPFDEFGRRTYEMMGRDGPLAVVQGITQITPVFTRVRGLMVEGRPYDWDMRIATSSIPRETLSRILARAVPQEDLDSRLQVVRLYLESERYRDARHELEKIVAEFPDQDELKKDVRQLRQMGAHSLLKELQLRDDAGQRNLVRQLLTQFPAEEVAGETLQQVRELLAEYGDDDAKREQVISNLRASVEGIKDPIHREVAERFTEEIAGGVDSNTLGRLTSFARLADDADLTADRKVALAISGWLIGANNATDNFPIALSLIQVRDKVIEYLRSDQPIRRSQIVAELRDLEGATVRRVAEVLKRIEPPKQLPESAELGPGFYQLDAAGMTGTGDVTYFVQLPAEYSPRRRYPTIVSLNGQGYSPMLQLDFWAGAPREDKPRLGQATRHGYITIAVDWQKPHQSSYEYSAREHHAVLGALRSALRHFSIDTDRVFLTGHDIGGDAAWDIALAHPDLWAGVIPVLAVAERYCARYWMNAEFVPWYFIEGEKDAKKMVRNASEFDRYLRPKFDATIVEYMGRGYEPFNDEIQRLFDWMNRRRRRPMPEEFECATMRPWDNYFWWVEVEDLPPKSMVDPLNWPPPRGARAARLRGKVSAANRVAVFARAGRATVWLTPELVDFDQQLTVEVNGRRITGRDRIVQPDLAVLLEDARTRGDRIHPFWARVDLPQRR